MLNQAVSIYNTQFFPGGVPNPNYPDPGDTQGYTGYLTEQYGAILAFNSLIDPSPSARIQYAQYARNMLMYAMNQAALGHLSGAPFRDPLFAVYNRANGSGEQWPLIVDWIYNATDSSGNAILAASDKLTIRNVFMMWANAATETLPSGQQLFVQTLLPHNASASAVYAAGNLTTIAELEPTQYVFTVEDSTLSADTEFLHVLQGADAGVAMTPATLVQSTSGAPFDGAAFGSAAVYFPVIRDQPFTGTTCAALAGVHQMLLTGLAPNTTYAVSVQPVGSGNTISVDVGSTGVVTDAAGVLSLSF